MPTNTLKKAIIIEDEENGRLVLQNLLQKYCPSIELVGMAASIKEAIPLIINKEPEIVFLDIELPENNGFTLFEHFPTSQFSTIFVTAYSDYALKALKMSAIDYLLKPINPEELIIAVGKTSRNNNEKVKSLVHNINIGLSKVALPTAEGLIFVEVESIMRCEAENNYTMVFFSDKKSILISKTLAYFDELLADFPFFRASRNALINMNFASRLQRGKKNLIVMNDGSEIILSENQRNEFLKIFKNSEK